MRTQRSGLRSGAMESIFCLSAAALLTAHAVHAAPGLAVVNDSGSYPHPKGPSVAAPGIHTVLTTTEGGGTAAFDVMLDSRPAASIDAFISVGDPSEGVVQRPASATLTFTPENWQTPQQIVISGLDDYGVDGDQTYLVYASVGTGDPVALVRVVNRDDEVVSIRVAPADTVLTDEGGTPQVLSVSLSSIPKTQVSVTVDSSDPGEGVVVGRLPLLFDNDNWHLPQQITVVGQDDELQDGDVSYTLDFQASASVGPYSAVSLQVDALNLDNDGVGSGTDTDTGSDLDGVFSDGFEAPVNGAG